MSYPDTQSNEDKPLDRDTLVSLLEQIGWSKASEMNGYAYRMNDHEGNNSKVLLKCDGAFLRDGEAEIWFMYKDCQAEMIDKDCVSLAQKDSTSVFINFYGEQRDV